jgi:CRP-like cAMP-binding protein
MNATRKTFPPFANVFVEGDAADSLFVVIKGSVEVVLQRAGKTVVLDTIKPGQCFGEMAALADSKRNATARTKEPCELLIIPSEDVKALLRQSDPLARTVVQALIERVRRMDEAYAKGFDSHFSLVAIARVLVLLAQGERPEAQRGTAFKSGDKPGTGEQVRVPMEKAVENGASIFGTLPFRFKEIIQQMVELNLVQLDVQQTGTGVKFRPAEIVSAAEKVEKSLGDLLEKRLTSDLDLVDVDQLSTLTGVDADKTWKKLVAGQMPKELILLRRQAALDLIATQGTAAFERRAFKKPEEFATLDDLEFIDDEILRTAFTKIESLDQGALLKVAPATLRARLAGTLSPRMKEIVEKAAAALAHVDDARARRLENRLVDLVKQTAAEAK